MDMIPIGHLVAGRVVRAYPDKDAYLVWLHESNTFALLPKRYQDHPLKIRDSVSAAVFKYGGAYPILSQRCAHFFRKIAESVLLPALREHGISVHRVATVEHADFVKIALKHSDPTKDPVKVCKALIPQFTSQISRTICLVRYSQDLEAYIVNALSPAPARAIRHIFVYREARRARVIVERGTIGAFLGKAAMNVATASKLTGIGIEPFDESELAGGTT